MAYSSLTVANYFIKKYGENGNITPLKLIKLVYIAYGWYLALNDNLDKVLVSEKPQAWGHGPVFSDLYQKVKNFGKDIITKPIDEQVTTMAITDDDAKFLDKIWDVYGANNDGIFLSAITHTPGTPWSETYPKGFNLTIPDILILDHYKSKIIGRP